MQAVKGTKDKSTGFAGLEIKPDGHDKIVKMEPKHPELHESLALGIEHIIGKDINPRFKKWGGFHASNTNECVRYTNYLFSGIEVPPDHTPRVQRIFDTGHDMHARISITGTASGEGKTTVVRFLLKNLEGFSALKSTTKHEGNCPRHSDCDVCETMKRPYTITTDPVQINQSGKDTALFKSAGARKVVWLKPIQNT